MSIVSGRQLLLSSAAAAAATGISRSLRFNSSDSAYLSRTPGSAGNRKTWTWAGWVKRAKFGGYAYLLSTGSDNTGIRFDPSTNRLELFDYPGSYAWQLMTTQVFRDPSAWFHVLVALDTTQATASNRLKLYVNGLQVTTFDTSNYPSQDYQGPINNNTSQAIGLGVAGYFDGYLADIYFIDGQALTPSSFTETDATTGQLIPKAYTGSYNVGVGAVNGFHLEFADNSSNTASTLGKDTSGNSPANNWTPNNLSVTAGAGNDSLVDVPVNGSETDTGLGGQVRGNYATLNPLSYTGAGVLRNGNLDFSAGASYVFATSTIGATSGIYYCEVYMNFATPGNWYDNNSDVAVGVSQDAPFNYSAGEIGDYRAQYYSSGTLGGFIYSKYQTGDTIGIKINLTTNAVSFYKNGVGVSGVGISAGKTNYFFVATRNSGSVSVNFGQRAWSYPANASDAKALCTANLPAPLVTKPSSVFDAVLYTGSVNNYTVNTSFVGDFVWIKERSAASSHFLYDAVRGGSNSLTSNNANAEITAKPITIGTSSVIIPGNTGSINDPGFTYVAWCWDAGTTTDPNNTAGSITSSVRANATAGFSIVGYTAPSSSGSNTVGHGLGIAPSMIITKVRSVSSTNWYVYHKSINTSTDQYLILNDTGGTYSYANSWGTALPTSSVFGIGIGILVNPSSTAISYCFAPVVGYSSFGSYTGNGSTDGPFVFTGMRPKWIMIKNSSAAGDSWVMHDTARNTYNVVDALLMPNQSTQETTSANYYHDILSNGFKLRTTLSAYNSSGATYIYAAFAEAPFNYARAR